MLTERNYGGEFLISEAPRTLSRDMLTIAASQTLKAGRLLGQVSIGALTGTFAGIGTPHGNPTCGTITTTAGTTVDGEFDIVMDDATHYHVLRPQEQGAGNGEVLVEGVLGSPTTVEGMTFTLTAGGTACNPADAFKITVTDATATDEGHYKGVDSAATDGSQVAKAILWDDVTTGVGATANVAAITRHAEVDSTLLDFGSLDSGHQATALAQLRTVGIIAR